jgi:hypothetical protein
VVNAAAPPWYQHPCFGPLAFYNVAGKESVPEGAASIVNKPEAEMVLCLYHNLTHAFPQLRKSGTVAVISPYKAQVGWRRGRGWGCGAGCLPPPLLPGTARGGSARAASN